MKKRIINFINENLLMIYYIVSSVLLDFYLRAITVGNLFHVRPLVLSLGIVMLISFFINLTDEKTRKNLYLIFIFLSTALCFVNSLYYENYTSYASVSFISTALQLERLEAGSFLGLLNLEQIFYFFPLIGYIILLVKTSKKEIKIARKVKLSQNIKTIIISLLLIGFSFIGKNSFNQWQREYNVMNFGIYAYQINDFYASLNPRIFPLIGYDQAKNNFNNYFQNKAKPTSNEYSNIFKDKNVLAIHAESIQTFLLDLEIGGEAVTPNLKKLAREGLYFSNFYAQESVGTSSDSEFTFATSLLPSTSGTVFVNYADREFVSIQELLVNNGYYTFSMHGNDGDFWNRNVMHKTLGYKNFFDASHYKIDEFVGLGLSDKSFFKQSLKKIKDINAKNEKFYGTLIMLTNHTPFTSLSENGMIDFDLTYEVNGQIDDHLEDTKMGHYLESSHYADQAIGEFIEALDKEGILDNTVIIIYGDHDAKLSQSSYDLLYNYDLETDSIKNESASDYINIDQTWIDLNRKVPLIIWTKDQTVSGEVTEVMGMIDVSPTLNNMLGIENEYQLGHDIFSIEKNIVVFPKGNWLTNKLYFDAQREEYYQIDRKAVVTLEEIEKHSKYASELIRLSNDIVKYDLLKDIF